MSVDHHLKRYCFVSVHRCRRRRRPIVHVARHVGTCRTFDNKINCKTKATEFLIRSTFHMPQIHCWFSSSMSFMFTRCTHTFHCHSIVLPFGWMGQNVHLIRCWPNGQWANTVSARSCINASAMHHTTILRSISAVASVNLLNQRISNWTNWTRSNIYSAHAHDVWNDYIHLKVLFSSFSHNWKNDMISTAQQLRKRKKKSIEFGVRCWTLLKLCACCRQFHKFFWYIFFFCFPFQ